MGRSLRRTHAGLVIRRGIDTSSFVPGTLFALPETDVVKGNAMKPKESDKLDTRHVTSPYARYLVHLIRPFPNFDASFIKPLRQKAVQLLQLKPGDRVLDTGCGPGGSFPYLVDAVGPSGEVVGVEISPE